MEIALEPKLYGKICTIDKKHLGQKIGISVESELLHRDFILRYSFELLTKTRNMNYYKANDDQ